MNFFLTLILALALTLTISAYASARTTNSEASRISPTSVPNADIGGDLLVWLPYEKHAQAFIGAFNAKYPNVNVKYEIIGLLETEEKSSLDGPAGIDADVVWNGGT